LKCDFHPAVDAIANCSNCDIPICGFCTTYVEDSTLCENCVELRAAEDFVASQTPQSDKLERMLVERQAKSESLDDRLTQDEEKRARREKRHVLMVGVSTIFIAVRVFFVLEASRDLTQDEIFAEELARSQVESCVLVFWEIAELLQNDSVPDESLRCEEPGDPNIVTVVGDDIIVTHPNPQLLGYSEIVVSKNNPIPELVI